MSLLLLFGGAGVQAPVVEEPAVVAAGKYAPEHAQAYVDVSNAREFSAEHSQAYRDVLEAGY